MRRQFKKNIPVVLTAKVTEATLDGGSGGSSSDFGPVGPAPLFDGAGSCDNSLRGSDGAGFSEGESIAGDLESKTT
jgi:hypothetical protein